MSGMHCGQCSPTPRQLEVLSAIREHQERRGYPISIRDLCEALGIRSTNAGADHIKALLRKGFVEKDGFVARSLRLTKQGERLLRSFAPEPKDGRTSFNLGRSAAGEVKADSQPVNEGEG